MVRKRMCDLVLSSILLVLLAPVMMLIAIASAFSWGRPVIFRQYRPGRNGKPFTPLKFRTMTDAHGVDGELLPDSRRLTRFGMFLRASSLDELPQLFNVLTGEMSLVGPRPLLTRYVTDCTQEQLRRLDVRPGITGWAQVNGRNMLCYDKRFELDVWYVDNHSFWLDARILWLTVIVLLKRDDVCPEGADTAPVFMTTMREGSVLNSIHEQASEREAVGVEMSELSH